MSHRNGPERLIEPADVVGRATNRKLGLPSSRETESRLAAIERGLAAANAENAALRAQLDRLRRVNVAASADYFQFGDLVLPANASIVARESSPNPGLTIGSAAGTGGSAAVSFPRGGSDIAGQIRVVCGTSGLGTGTLVTLAFTEAKANTNYIVLLSPMSSAARSVNLSVSTLTANGFPILANTAPGSGNQIDIAYLVIEVPAP